MLGTVPLSCDSIELSRFLPMLRNPLKNISIQEKLGLLSGVLLCAVFVVWLAGYQGIQLTNSSLETAHVSLAMVRNDMLADMMHEKILSLPFRALAIAELQGADEAQILMTQVRQFSEQLDSALDEIEALPIRQEVGEILSALRPAVREYVTKAKDITGLALRGQFQQALQATPDFIAISQKLEGGLKQLKILVEADVEQTWTWGITTATLARRAMIGILLLAMLFAFLFSWRISCVITSPLVEMATVASRLAEGNIDQRILHHSRDELGVLATAFRDLITYIRNLAEVATRISQGDLRVEVVPRSEHDVLSLSFIEMIKDLQDMNSRMQQGARTLASSIDQIMVIMQQVAASTTETATSVSETAMTVEEVKQTVSAANQNAQQVAENSQRTVQVSQAGEHAVEEALVGMQRMRTQMETIARSVGQLGEQSQTIRDIIRTVNDLAGRSNLLAINAAIEAAKAGEAGKGFSVVAHEVKSLADQSKRATAQVYTMLNDIQKAAQVAILVTEQGTRSAELGSTQAAQAGEAIRALSQNISDAAHSVTKIATSSQQQLLGMDQVATAMNSIKLASTQNANGIKDIESAIRDIHLVGQTLKELVEQYKLTTPPNGQHPSLAE